jgi:hypothetical protein
MYPESILEWSSVLAEMVADDSLLNEAFAENEWFLPALQKKAIQALLPMLDPSRLRDLRNQYPAVSDAKRVGLILAGNIPLVGFHDLLMVLLSGHQVIVKPSHKDRVLLNALVAKSPADIRARIAIVESLEAMHLDCLIATGSNNTARQVEADFAQVPKILLRRNRFSVGLIKGNEDVEALKRLGFDILLFHGMGCRSVSNLLVPNDYDLKGLISGLNDFPEQLLANSWWQVQKYQSAIAQVLDRKDFQCAGILINEVSKIGIPNFGELNVLRYASSAQYWEMLAAVKDELQCIVGEDFIPFGEAQCPEIDDWADGVDVLRFLTSL